ncbi:MAG: type IV pilus twitching motility protein PilT [Gemmatimonadota bacterium]|nr:type IV pilus twitching motility protein PilT [Gemmatimonadota bacterium]
MPQLDRFLAVLVTNHGTALHLVTDDVAKLEIGGIPRPITRQPFTAAQMLGLLREISTPDVHRRLERGEPATFSYASEEGTFTVAASMAGGRLTAMLSPMANGSPPSNGSPSSNGTPRPVTIDMAAVTPTGSSDAARVDIDALLRQLVERQGSDLHLRVDEPPIIRMHGEMMRLQSAPPLTNERLEAMLLAIMPDRNRREYTEINDTDFAYEIPGVARFRCNALRDRKGAGAVARVIPAAVVTAEQLGLSTEVQQLCYLTKGLVLVTGPTGSGKSTTLCALVDLINRMRTDHIITIEDPIEFVHPNKNCIITQRQVGVHTSSFKHALRAALREDPDIVLVGELRDLETMSIAIETAETGHLVFGTLHTTTAASTIDRIIDQFPPDRQEQIRVMLSESLKGVISQTLCKKAGGGRIAAREILLSIPAISNLIREGKTFQIPSIMQTSRRLGMVTLNDALIELVDKRQVEPREAYLKAIDKLIFANMLRQRGHDLTWLDQLDPGASAAAKPEAAKPGGKPVAAKR